MKLYIIRAFDCLLTRRLCFASNWGIHIDRFKHLSPTQWLAFILNSRAVRACLGIDARELFNFASIAFDRIRWLRNQVIHDNQFQIHEFNRWVSNIRNDFFEVIGACIPPPKVFVSHNWNLPSQGWIEINFDAAIKSKGSSTTTICVESLSNVLESKVKFMHGSQSSDS
ncbi:hypothetical protein O6P43_026634 [Quillaja saponaria]|uniref:Uncharacterized protein n=1 Tax=Quillaja saponaria TaxID=32244 RepID=A0AAD7PCE6_QUISA|nr:hypothetical protein O6P43_026634 [Quillaja saponaria]